MKRLIFFALALMIAGNALAANTLSIMEDGKILPQYLPTVELIQSGDPTNASDGQLWYNNATNQLKVRDGDMVYFWNATGSEAFDDGIDSCTGDYGVMSDGGSWGSSGANLITVARTAVCDGGTPDLKIVLAEVSSTGREIIPVVYANVENGAGDSDDRPGALLWSGDAYYNSTLQSTPAQITFSVDAPISGDIVWIGVLAESASTYLRQATGTGYYRSYTTTGFSTGDIPTAWPVSDSGSSSVILSIGASY
jgi:hypothetical protein